MDKHKKDQAKKPASPKKTDVKEAKGNEPKEQMKTKRAK